MSIDPIGGRDCPITRGCHRARYGTEIPDAMKPKHPKNKKNQATNTPASNRSSCLAELDEMSAAFDRETRSRLPDGVLGGVLRNHEVEIRQDAVLILLKWYLEQHQGHTAGGARKRRKHHCCWNLRKAAAYALKYAKLRHIDRLATETGSHESLTEANGGVSQHAVDQPLWRLPRAVRQSMALCGIRRAADRCLISAGNADVARLVLEEGMSIKRVAAQHGVTRGAIYQQLRRVGAVVSAIMAEIEVPNFGLG